MSAPFAPKNAESITQWACDNQTTHAIACRRFVQAISIYTIAGDSELSQLLQLYGSATLSILHGTRRTAVDLDFWCSRTHVPDDAARNELHQRINRALNKGLPRFIPFDPYWRPILASQIKVQLTSDKVMNVESELVPLAFDPPLSIHAATLRANLAMKIIALIDGIKAREHDIYDVADVFRHSMATREEVIAQMMMQLPPRSATFPGIRDRLEESRARYRAKFATGEFDIPWDDAWETYGGLLRELPGYSDLGID